jgi:Xaa-Pro aminopeptidase
MARLCVGAFRPGATCADIDQAVFDYLAAHDLMPYWRQHTGHAIGLRNHEPPFLDIGDFTPIEPGMVFTIEQRVRQQAGGRGDGGQPAGVLPGALVREP